MRNMKMRQERLLVCYVNSAEEPQPDCNERGRTAGFPEPKKR